MPRSVLALLLLAGCATAGSSVATVPSPVAEAALEPSPAPSPETAPSESPAEAGACQARIRTVALRTPGGTYEVLATVTNETESTLDASWTAPCPGPGARFAGLPDGYDAGGACARSACGRGSEQVRHRSIAPGAREIVASIVVTPGGDSCNQPLPPGRYSVGAELAIEGIRVCAGERAVFVVPPRASPAPDQTPSASRVLP